MLTPDDRTAAAELAPLLRRAVSLDPRGLARLRLRGGTATALVRLPFNVLVSRAVEAPQRSSDLDLTARADELLAWIGGEGGEPEPRDLEWRAGLPPTTGWHRVETVPDAELRPLVRSGAMALREAAEREGVPGAQPRAEVADALLDAVVLTATDDEVTVSVTLRAVSALTRMGFLRADGHAHVDVAGRWVRLTGEYGSVFLERPGHALGVL